MRKDIMVLNPRWPAAASVLLCAATAWAQGPAASKVAADKAGADQLNSFAAIQAHFNQLQEESQKAIEKQRLAALEAFLPKAPEDDREAVLGTMVGLALALEAYDQAIVFSDKFLKDFPKSDGLSSVYKLRISALAQADRLAEARKDWETLLKKGETDQVNDVVEAGMELAEAFTDSGNVKAARQVYETLRNRLPDAIPENQRPMIVQQLEQLLSPRLASLELIGQTPAALEGKTLAGETVDLAKYKGKVVLLDFWATWCNPCVAALPSVKAAYDKYHARGFEVIGISLDVNAEPLKEFVKQRGLAWPQLWDNQRQPGTPNPFGGPNSRRYNLTAIPATFLLDRDGRILRVNVPARGLDDAVSRALAKPATRPAGVSAPTDTEPGNQP